RGTRRQPGTTSRHRPCPRHRRRARSLRHHLCRSAAPRPASGGAERAALKGTKRDPPHAGPDSGPVTRTPIPLAHVSIQTDFLKYVVTPSADEHLPLSREAVEKLILSEICAPALHQSATAASQRHVPRFLAPRAPAA